MGNINFLNFRKAPTDAALAEATREILDDLFPNLDIFRVNAEACLAVEVFPDTPNHEWFEYFRYSRRRIGSKGPRSNWMRWVFYLIRCRLIERFGGTCRDEWDMNHVEDLDISRYPSYRDWLEKVVYPDHTHFRKDLGMLKKIVARKGREALIKHSADFDRDRGFPVDAEARL